MKREHWPEVGWWWWRAWAEAWAKGGGALCRGSVTARSEQRLQDGSAACFDGVGQGCGWAGSGEAERWELRVDGVGRRRLGLGLATATSLALVLRGDESLMRDEGWWERSERWWAWWEVRAWWERWESLMRWWKKKERLQRFCRSTAGLGMKEWIKE